MMTSLILTADQHAQLRAVLRLALNLAMDVADPPAVDPADADDVGLAAADALDMLDGAALELWALATPGDGAVQ